VTTTTASSGIEVQAVLTEADRLKQAETMPRGVATVAHRDAHRDVQGQAATDLKTPEAAPPSRLRTGTAAVISCLGVVAALVEVGVVSAALVALAWKLLWWLTIGTAGGALVIASLAEALLG
jgi:hypothetical protein